MANELVTVATTTVYYKINCTCLQNTCINTTLTDLTWIGSTRERRIEAAVSRTRIASCGLWKNCTARSRQRARAGRSRWLCHSPSSGLTRATTCQSYASEQTKCEDEAWEITLDQNSRCDGKNNLRYIQYLWSKILKGWI